MDQIDVQPRPAPSSATKVGTDDPAWKQLSPWGRRLVALSATIGVLALAIWFVLAGTSAGSTDANSWSSGQCERSSALEVAGEVTVAMDSEPDLCRFGFGLHHTGRFSATLEELRIDMRPASKGGPVGIAKVQIFSPEGGAAGGQLLAERDFTRFDPGEPSLSIVDLDLSLDQRGIFVLVFIQLAGQDSGGVTYGFGTDVVSAKIRSFGRARTIPVDTPSWLRRVVVDAGLDPMKAFEVRGPVNLDE